MPYGRKRRPNSYRIVGNKAHITLTRGYHAIVDTADVPWLLYYRWRAISLNGKIQAGAPDPDSGVHRTLLLHRCIMGEPRGNVFARNGDYLDCRRANLSRQHHAPQA